MIFQETHKETNQQVTWRKGNTNGVAWNFQSVNDVFENGASFGQTGGGVKPNYIAEQKFKVADARSVRSLTRSSGALRCPRIGRCL